MLIFSVTHTLLKRFPHTTSVCQLERASAAASQPEITIAKAVHSPHELLRAWCGEHGQPHETKMGPAVTLSRGSPSQRKPQSLKSTKSVWVHRFTKQEQKRKQPNRCAAMAGQAASPSPSDDEPVLPPGQKSKRPPSTIRHAQYRDCALCAYASAHPLTHTFCGWRGNIKNCLLCFALTPSACCQLDSTTISRIHSSRNIYCGHRILHYCSHCDEKSHVVLMRCSWRAHTCTTTPPRESVGVFELVATIRCQPLQVFSSKHSHAPCMTTLKLT